MQVLREAHVLGRAGTLVLRGALATSASAATAYSASVTLALNLTRAARRRQDYYRDRDAQLSSMPLKAFMTLIFQHCPGLAPFAPQRDDILAQFTAFKQSVPVMGAILLEPRLEKVLLVRGFQAAASWGFPRGKVSKDEKDAECAVREARAAQRCVSQGGRPATRRLVLAVCSNARLCGQRRVRAPHIIAPCLAAGELPWAFTTLRASAGTHLLLRGSVLRAWSRKPPLTGESRTNCVVPQVREETGYDVRPLLVDEDCIEMHIGQQRSKLFIIAGVRGPPTHACRLRPPLSCVADALEAVVHGVSGGLPRL